MGLSQHPEGILTFGLSTESTDKIEIKRVDFDYAAFDGTEFLEPQNMGFFEISVSNDRDFPFRLSWAGSIFVDKRLIQVFAISVKARTLLHEQSIRITVHAQKHKIGMGGFPTTGRIQLASFEKIIAFTENNFKFRVSPKCSITSPQAFIIQGTITASGLPNGEVVIHEILNDGKASSRRINL